MISDNKPLALLVALPAAGHYIPLLRLADALSSSFQVVFACSEYELPKLKMNPQVTALALKDQNNTLLHTEMKQIPFVYFMDEWYPQLLSYMRTNRPKIVIADFFSEPAMRVASELKITTVIHAPMPYGMIMEILDFPMLGKNKNIAGLTVVGPDPLGLVIPKYVKPLRELGKYFDKSLVIFNTFFGLEKAASLPPNIKLIGPSIEIAPLDPAAFDSDLTEFLVKVRANNKNIIYVTFGSVLKLTQNFITYLYEGLKKTDEAVIWSLRDGQVPEDNPHFFVRKWLPQKDILLLDEVKVVITHCGWGGFTECLVSEKPMLAVPGFGDQPSNALLLEERGLGLILRPQPIRAFEKLID